MEYVVAKANIYELEHIYTAYSQTFPEIERRSKKAFMLLPSIPNACVYAIYLEGKMVAYMVAWHLSTCLFIEHIEVFVSFRNKNIASTFFKQLKKSYNNIVLEIEPPTDETSTRRFNFYHLLDFKIIDKNYLQPSYHNDDILLPLWLLASTQEQDVQHLKREIYTTVYATEYL